MLASNSRVLPALLACVCAGALRAIRSFVVSHIKFAEWVCAVCGANSSLAFWSHNTFYTLRIKKKLHIWNYVWQAQRSSQFTFVFASVSIQMKQRARDHWIFEAWRWHLTVIERRFEASTYFHMNSIQTVLCCDQSKQVHDSLYRISMLVLLEKEKLNIHCCYYGFSLCFVLLFVLNFFWGEIHKIIIVF